MPIFTLIANFKLGVKCKIERESHVNYQATAALNTYFYKSAISRRHKWRSHCDSYIDKVVVVSQRVKLETCGLSARLTNVYNQSEALSLITDPALQRTLKIYHHHMSDVIARNPGVELSCSMPNMTNEGYKTMVCVETGCVSRPLVIAVEQPARLAVTLCSRKNT